jgi:shikimate kinase
MSDFKRIFITGHPGAGKALLAKTLSEQLGWQFIDADLGLEFSIGRGLNEILGSEGKAAFYECHAEILANLLNKEHIVVATDGSIVCSEKNRQLLASEFVVFLNVSTYVQMERTARNPAPLLLVRDVKAFLDTLHAERDHLYEEGSSLTINGDDSALEQHVIQIINTLKDNSGEIKAPITLTLDNKDLTLFHKNLHVPVHLSPQQALCIKLLVQGKSSKIIAREMNISHRTVEGTIAKTMEQLGCSSSKELIALYYDE